MEIIEEKEIVHEEVSGSGAYTLNKYGIFHSSLPFHLFRSIYLFSFQLGMPACYVMLRMMELLNKAQNVKLIYELSLLRSLLHLHTHCSIY
jgi:hypothetical protein